MDDSKLKKEEKFNLKKQEISNKMKENIIKFLSQFKNGCHRKFCYNPYCAKSNCKGINNNLGMPSKINNDYLVEVIQLSRLANCEQFICKDLRGLFQEKTNNFFLDIESFALSLDKQEKYLENNFNNNLLVKINLDFEKVNKICDTKTTEEFTLDLININKFFNSFIDKDSKNYLDDNYEEKHNKRLLYYLYYLYSKILIYISISPNFCVWETLAAELITFFQNYTDIKSKVKKIENKSNSNNEKKNFNDSHISNKYSNKKVSFISTFEELKISPSEFSKIINNYQNFLTLVLFHIGDVEDDMRDEKSFQVLINFMKIFKLFYQINEKFNILGFKDFYSESVSKYLNLQEECKTYFKILNLNNSIGEKPFCLIKYHWLFDSAAKSDILYIFNYKKQRAEMISSLSNLLNLNLNAAHGMFLYLEVRRNNLIEDTLNFISNSQLNFRKPLKIKFVGEQGIDEGGVKKEFFILLIRQLFDPNYGMFSYNEKNRFFWFNPNTFESKIKFELIGIILGLAFFNNVILDIKFPLVVYKKILGLETTIDDLREIDLELYNNLKYLLNTEEKNLKENLMTNFTVVVDQFGEKIIVPLMENGENIFIEEHNKEVYVKLYLDWFFNSSIENVFYPFRVGFYRVCENKLFHMLRSEELELIICGSQILDFKELEKVARYDDGYEKDSLTIKYFWEVIHSLIPEQQKKFLFFLTGCDRAPINGLGSLVITISRFGPDSGNLPCAHTCFNHLLLPDYQNKEKLRERVLIAINNAEGFGLM